MVILVLHCNLKETVRPSFFLLKEAKIGAEGVVSLVKKPREWAGTLFRVENFKATPKKLKMKIIDQSGNIKDKNILSGLISKEADRKEFRTNVTE